MKTLVLLFTFVLVILDALRDGLEMESRITKKDHFSQFGHIVRILLIVYAFYFGYFISTFDLTFLIFKIIISYIVIRFCFFNYIYNLTAFEISKWSYSGVVDIFDKLFNKISKNPFIWLFIKIVLFIIFLVYYFIF